MSPKPILNPKPSAPNHSKTALTFSSQSALSASLRQVSSGVWVGFRVSGVGLGVEAVLWDAWSLGRRRFIGFWGLMNLSSMT